MIDAPDDPLGYDLEPIPERPRPTPRLSTPPPTEPLLVPRRRLRVRIRYVLLGAYLLGAALIWFHYETSDAARARRLSRFHHDQAARYHQAAVAARRRGRIDEAAILDDLARNHVWFADAYRAIIRDRPRWHPRPLSSEQAP